MASASVVADLRPAPKALWVWYEENKEKFAPPICNFLMHKDQLAVQFVGGPNTRTDFHLDLGSEFFFQIKGNMSLPTIQRGELKVVDILEGQVYLLPSRVPHSPQRPESEALGLVVERRRDEDELDGLRWYCDFSKPKEVLYERHFHCADLGRDLVPVVMAFKASDECATLRPKVDSVPSSRPWEIDHETVVPDPFDLKGFIEAHAEELSRGADINLFEGHPDGEFMVRVVGGPSTQTTSFEYETLFFQLQGEAAIIVSGREGEVLLGKDVCFVVDSGVDYTAKRQPGSVGLVITQNPLGNKRDRDAAKKVKVA